MLLAGAALVGGAAVALPTACAAAKPYDHAINFVPQKTPYETVHDLAYSLMFEDGNSAVFGTGWMFDFATDASNDTTTVYLATNLHVADALRYPNDPTYPYTQADVQAEQAQLDKAASSGDDKQQALPLTSAFYLGRYDDSDGSLSSKVRNANVTYIRFTGDSLPKTQYAAVAKVGAAGGWAYIDFAVLAVTFNMYTDAAPVGKAETAERDAYVNWVQGTSIPALKSLANPNNAAPNYMNMFYGSSDGTGADLLKGQNVYAGGYPEYDVSDASPGYVASTGGSLPVSGSPAWTINVPYGTTDPTLANGQPFDVSNSVAPRADLTPAGPAIVDAATASGAYSGTRDPDWSLSYHGRSYADAGYMYFASASNLAAGASGSLGLTMDSKIVGIYFGTLADDTSGKEEPVGLFAPLIVPYSLVESLYPKNDNAKQGSTTPAYDLIGGKDAGWGSYATSLGDVSSYLFPKEQPTAAGG